MSKDKIAILKKEIEKLENQISRPDIQPGVKKSFEKVRDLKKKELEDLEKKPEPAPKAKKTKAPKAPKTPKKKKAVEPVEVDLESRTVKSSKGVSEEDCMELLKNNKKQVKKHRKAVEKSEKRSTPEKVSTNLEGFLKNVIGDKKVKAKAKSNPGAVKKAKKNAEAAIKNLIKALKPFGIEVSAARVEKIIAIFKDLDIK